MQDELEAGLGEPKEPAWSELEEGQREHKEPAEDKLELEKIKVERIIEEEAATDDEIRIEVT